jgi:hypothetical protein
MDWAHNMLSILSAGTGRHFELVKGQGWVPIPPERCTDEYKQREIQRLCNELGRRLGVGDCPRLPPRSCDWYVSR